MTKTITTFLTVLMLGAFATVRAQSFKSVYEFTGAAVCPITALGITSQPTHVTFSDFKDSNVVCSATIDVYNHSGWNTTSSINLDEFIEFSVTAEDCYRLDLDTLVFTFRNSSTTSFPNWHIRSSMDNYGSDIKTGGSSNNLKTDTIVLDPLNFGSLTAVTFRFYITDIQLNTNTWRVDNVRTFGSVSFFGNLPFYVDADNDGYGGGSAVPMCSNPGGYSLLAGDCDDTNPLINPNTIWYADIDNDGYGNPGVSEVGCTSSLANATLDNTDCNDVDPALNSTTIWYADVDLDGFGDDNTTETGCTSTLTNAILIPGDCNDAAAIINPNTIWYEDADNDGYGNELSIDTACVSMFAIACLQGGDCDDSQETVYLGAAELCDGLDNNCDSDIDEDLQMTEYFIDADHDLYGGGSAGVFCYDPGVDYAINGGDCADEDPNINPGMPEIPGDTIDENCDGSLVGLDELASYQFELFPNPGTNELHISTCSLMQQALTVSILDLQGKIQIKQNFEGLKGIVMLQTQSLKAGIYLVQIELPEGIKTVKWTKL